MPKRKTKSSQPLEFSVRVKLLLGFVLILISYISLGNILKSSNLNLEEYFSFFGDTKSPPAGFAKSEKVSLADESFSDEPIKPAVEKFNASEGEKPQRVIIPSGGIDISVVEAKVVEGYWELSETTASHGQGSAYPGQKGNAVIFAHAREGLFYNLKEASIGDEIYVFTQDKWFSYKVSDIKTVYPNQVEVVSPTEDERLTLYTCSGFLDEKRLIVTAKRT